MSWDWGSRGGGGGVPAGAGAWVPGNYTAALSVRRAKQGYAGSCLRVQRDADDEELDIGFRPDGLMDVLALWDFLGASTGLCHTWYSQTNAIYNAVAPSKSEMPVISASGVLQAQEGLPALLFSGGKSLQITGAGLDILNNRPYGRASIIAAPSDLSGTANFLLWISRNATASRFVAALPGNTAKRARIQGRRLDGDGQAIADSDTDFTSDQQSFVFEIDYTAGAGEIRQNGVSVATTSGISEGNTSATSSQSIWIGRAISGGATHYEGTISEIIIDTTSAPPLEENQMDFFLT